jgi:hypothetical protein
MGADGGIGTSGPLGGVNDAPGGKAILLYPATDAAIVTVPKTGGNGVYSGGPGGAGGGGAGGCDGSSGSQGQPGGIGMVRLELWT